MTRTGSIVGSGVIVIILYYDNRQPQEKHAIEAYSKQQQLNQ